MRKIFISTGFFLLITVAITTSIAFGQTPLPAETKGIDANAPSTSGGISAQQLVTVMESKAKSREERLQALHSLSQIKKILSKPEQVQFLQSIKTLALDKQEDPSFEPMQYGHSMKWACCSNMKKR